MLIAWSSYPYPYKLMLRSVARRLKLILFGAILLSTLSIWTVSKGDIQPSELRAQPAISSDTRSDVNAMDTAIDPRLLAANTRFGFKLFSQVLQQQDENVLISPVSISIALGMTNNGASGETQQAMQRTLELEGMSLEQINQANQALLSQLKSGDPDVMLTIANSLWAKEGIQFDANFLQRNRTFYAADVTTLNMGQPDAVNRINAWVNDQTAGKIPQIVQSIDPNDILFLINAIYFKGNWTAPFDPQATIDQPFHLADGTVKSHPLMAQRGQYGYLETEQFQAIQLPYGNQRWQMYVFLPQPNSDLSSFMQTLTPENWQTWSDAFEMRPGTVQLPRFRLEYGLSLINTLEALGMGIAFDPDRADLSAMTDRPAFISEVQHQTFMEVNEAGTEAAAATSVTVTTRGFPQSPFQMTIDRPFFCAVQDEQTGTILFMGAIREPQG